MKLFKKLFALPFCVTLAFPSASFADGDNNADGYSAVESALDSNVDELLSLAGVIAVEVSNCGSKWVPRALGTTATDEVESFVPGVRVSFDSKSSLENFARTVGRDATLASSEGSVPLCAQLSSPSRAESDAAVKSPL